MAVEGAQTGGSGTCPEGLSVCPHEVLMASRGHEGAIPCMLSTTGKACSRRKSLALVPTQERMGLVVWCNCDGVCLFG